MFVALGINGLIVLEIFQMGGNGHNIHAIRTAHLLSLVRRISPEPQGTGGAGDGDHGHRVLPHFPGALD
ncbi:MAG: hypothetical protein CMJ81_15120 [Planctomycetaceae bacterium]|nr:hypothetical protein [Planctomycetaceae bacterium]